MPRELTELERTNFLLRNPDATVQAAQYDEGLIFRDQLGCIFVFRKQDSSFVFAEVSDVYPTCTAQAIPPPSTVFTELSDWITGIGQGLGKLLTAGLWILAAILVIQSGILKGLFRE
jgi:hypothetical protein